MRPLIVIILVIIALALLKVYVWDKSENPAEQKMSSAPTQQPRKSSSLGLPVDIYVAELTPSANTIYASGTITPNEEVEIRSEVSGRLEKLNIQEGRYVKKGQLIAKLNDDELTAQLKKIAFDEQFAEQTEARQKKLLDINAISKEEYDLAVNRVNTLGADKDLLKVRLEKTEVRAPFSGYIGFKYISEGAYITPSTVIATLVQSQPVKIDFSIPEKYANAVSIRQPVRFETDGISETFSAEIYAINPKVDEDLRILELRAKTNNPNNVLKPGMFVRLEIPLESQPAIMIPTEAVLPVLKGKVVYRYEGGQAKETRIRTGIRTESEVQVIEGLSPGDSVIVSALMTLKPSLKVQVKEIVNP